jgi:hypothetical protein
MVFRRYVFILRSTLNDCSAENEVAGIAVSMQDTFQNRGRTLSRSERRSLKEICSSSNLDEISFSVGHDRFNFSLGTSGIFSFPFPTDRRQYCNSPEHSCSCFFVDLLRTTSTKAHLDIFFSSNRDPSSAVIMSRLSSNTQKHGSPAQRDC